MYEKEHKIKSKKQKNTGSNRQNKIQRQPDSNSSPCKSVFTCLPYREYPRHPRAPQGMATSWHPARFTRALHRKRTGTARLSRPPRCHQHQSILPLGTDFTPESGNNPCQIYSFRPYRGILRWQQISVQGKEIDFIHNDTVRKARSCSPISPRTFNFSFV